MESETELYDEDATQKLTAADVEVEIEELREVDTKHLRMSDGTYIAVKYDTNLHYQGADGE